MALRESGEDYLESIYVLSERQGIVRSIDVAEYLGVTKASVSKAMATLENNGYVEMGKRDVHLTERGLEVARQMWERHCFFVGLLEDAGVSEEVASQEGCHMEHCLSEESFEKLRAMLNRDAISAPTTTDQQSHSSAPPAPKARDSDRDKRPLQPSPIQTMNPASKRCPRTASDVTAGRGRA